MIKNNKIIFILTVSGFFLLGIGLFVLVKNLEENKVTIQKLELNISDSNKKLDSIIENINISYNEISSLNLKISVLNEELSLFNKTILKNETDLYGLQLKMKDVIADLRKLKYMTELQNRKLYVSE